MTASGPGLLDLASLTAGSWREAEKAELALTYHAALKEMQGCPPQLADADDFLTALEYCHLHQAIHWLGRFGRRQAFALHAHDWLGEALRLAEKLKL